MTHPHRRHAAFLSAALLTIFGVVFAAVAVHVHREFNSLAWDLGIYDQAYWLVSRFGETTITVRGLDVWGHHVNLVAFLYVPFYRLGAGPELLLVSQALVLALGGLAVHLLATRRLGSPWFGSAMVLAYVLYSPLEWLSLADYHPEALVVTPFLFAWYFADARRWRAYAIAAALVLMTREDAALPLLLFGVVLVVRHRALRRSTDRLDRRAFWAGPTTIVVAAAYYLVCTRIVLPHFNGGRQPYYLEEFYGEWGGSIGRVAANVIRDPMRVLGEAGKPDRLTFARDLLAPFGFVPVLAFPIVGLAGVQILGSVIGASPYARMAIYQYTAMMIAPIVIAAIVAIGRWLRTPRQRAFAVAWVVVCAVVTNITSSPSPFGRWESVVGANPNRAELEKAIGLVPADARVSATYHLVPHLSGRRYVYEWPNPFATNYWANRDENPHDPATIEWFVVTPEDVDAGFEDILGELTTVDGQFEVVHRSENVVVGRRVRPAPP